MPCMRVAFLGLGIMGRPMAANLVKAGHDVTVWNRTPGKTVDGARVAASPAEAGGVARRDAPVTGSKIGAEAATLIFIVGGEEATIAKVEPLFQAMGKLYKHM